MDSERLFLDDEGVEEQEPKQMTVISPLPSLTASISLSLITTLLPSPTQLFASESQQRKKALCTLPVQSRVKVPSVQAATLSFSVPILSRRSSSKSTSSANPFQSPLSLVPRLPSDPSAAGALRRTSICWFRNDLRLHDNDCLSSANNDSLSVLPVYCFDPKDYGKSSSGFDKTGPHRASFVIQSVADLRTSLRERGSDLVVRLGSTESVLTELARKIGADAVYVHGEVSHADVRTEERVQNAMKEEGVEVKLFWGSTLFHLDDLPFKLEDIPPNYGSFREKVKGLQIRENIPIPEDLKGLPCAGDIEPGDIPSLLDLGFSSHPKNSNGAFHAFPTGGETQALQRIQKLVAECQAKPPKSGSQDSIYAANFSCRMSAWLTMGCISPRLMFDELKTAASRTISAASAQKNSSSDAGPNWLMFELLWRDFFRFITRKCSTQQGRKSTACGATPSFA